MKVFPTLVKEQTFSLSELITAVELLRDQQVLQQAHTDARVEVPEHLERAIATGYCPGCILHAHRQTCDTQSDTESDVSDSTTALSPPAVVMAPPPPPATFIAPTTAAVAPPATIFASQGSTSASVRWYVITVGRETGVFQGWHNVHAHVVGVPGACFGRYSSRASAEEAFAQAVHDGTVQEL
ncbi:hypothetical protein P692DRAFT_20848737, partial [Suillus brevipes Sb2]